MKTRNTFLTFLLVIVLSIMLNAQTSTPPAGSGTIADPYQIATLDNLYWLSQQMVADGTLDKHYIQTADIDASATSGWDSGSGFSPIPVFTGTYNGQNNTISNLTINRPTANNVGFINSATTSPDALVENLGLTNVNIIGRDYVGALVGKLYYGTVRNCYSSGSVEAVHVYAGGLVGTNRHGAIIEYSSSSADVIGAGANNGGLVGYSRGGSPTPIIRYCSTSGSVTAAGGFGGGITGTGLVDISYCYTTGEVVGNGGDRFGGIVGGANGTISNCHSSANVTGPNRVGGLVGRNYGTVVNSYSVGVITCAGAQKGGAIGYATTGTVTDCFWDTETSGMATSYGGTAKTTAEMKLQATFTDASWDFGSIWEIIAPPSNSLAKVNADGNYPRLQSNADPALPVELTLFSATVNEGSISLSWSTATEVNNYGFEVERKIETANWEKVAFVEGAGNSNSVKNYTYNDNAVGVKGTYSYRLKQVDIDGNFEYSDVVEVNYGIPTNFELSQNYPNPFNPTTTIKFSFPEATNVELTVYNLIGEKVAELVNNKMEAGIHTVNFDASELTSGIYIYKIKTSSFTKTMKMMLLK